MVFLCPRGMDLNTVTIGDAMFNLSLLDEIPQWHPRLLVWNGEGWEILSRFCQGIWKLCCRCWSARSDFFHHLLFDNNVFSEKLISVAGVNLRFFGILGLSGFRISSESSAPFFLYFAIAIEVNYGILSDDFNYGLESIRVFHRWMSWYNILSSSKGTM